MVALKLFAASLLVTAGLLSGLIYLGRDKRSPGDDPDLVPVGKQLSITSQLTWKGVTSLKQEGVSSLVDLRPDGEDPDELPSAQVEALSKAYGMDFHYIPVPHGDIPESAVTALGEVLSHRSGRTVLYCRSGKRAGRTFALTEASRPDGPTADAICDTVRTAGFSADDLRADINQRVARRNDPPADQHP